MNIVSLRKFGNSLVVNLQRSSIHTEPSGEEKILSVQESFTIMKAPDGSYVVVGNPDADVVFHDIELAVRSGRITY